MREDFSIRLISQSRMQRLHKSLSVSTEVLIVITDKKRKAAILPALDENQSWYFCGHKQFCRRHYGLPLL